MQLKTLFTNTASIIQNMPIELVGTQANSSQKFPPDAEIIFREWAINTTNITAVCSTRVATRLPRNATLPF